MRIGLASDTLGNVDALGRALDIFSRAQVDKVFFLGARVADLASALGRRRSAPAAGAAPAGDLAFLEAVRGALGRQPGAPAADPLEGRVVKVASRACPEYQRDVPAKLIELVAGQICCLVHDKSELSRDDISNATVLFHGNSARAALVQIGPRFFVTPGHLGRTADAESPSFAMLEVEPQELELVVFGEDGAEVRRERAAFGTRGKMTVR